jgi:hypothetical protein
MTWKIDPPASPGLYIASTDKAACWARYWTGRHWTAPVHVSDLTDASRVPDATWPQAEMISSRSWVYWLEPCVYDADGWVSWGAFTSQCPVAPDLRVLVRMADGWESAMTSRAGALLWSSGVGDSTITAYKVVLDNEKTIPVVAAPAPASITAAPPAANQAEKPSNPKDVVGVRKAPMSTVSAAVMAEVGVAMLEGALKYGRHNYRAVGVRSSVYYDGTLRHLMAWWEGEDIDPDSGMSHITKAITSLVVLRDAMIQGKCEDDRAPRSTAFYPELNARAAALMDKHADKAPKHYTIGDAA